MKEFQEKIRQYINWISVGILCIASIGISLFQADSGGVRIKEFPTTWYGWALWAIVTFSMPTVGVMIVASFRQEGIRQGHMLPEVKEARDKWISLTAKDTKSIKPRSKAAYNRDGAKKDILMKFPAAAVLSIAAVSVAISADLSTLISLLLQLIVFLGSGAITLFQATEYCTEELLIWYKREIKRIEDSIQNDERLKEKGNVRLQEEE